MLYRTGFAVVCRAVTLPEHDDFRDTAEHARKRTVLLASLSPIDIAGFRWYPEPRDGGDPWNKGAAARPSVARRIGRFLASPAREKYIAMALRARRVFPGMSSRHILCSYIRAFSALLLGYHHLHLLEKLRRGYKDLLCKSLAGNLPPEETKEAATHV